ncbi:MAG: ATP-binding protein [Treponema sp.]|nr:ATP-binding protein [Treponema sp.]
MSVDSDKVINKQITKKFSFPLIILTAGCCLVVLVIYILLFNRELHNAMYRYTDVAAMVTAHEIENLKSNGRIAAMGIANDPGLKEAIINNDREQIIRTINILRVIAQVDYCSVLDKDGIVIVRTHEPDIYGDSLAHLPHVKTALEGKREAYVSHGVTIDMGVYGGAPIRDDEMNIIGIISLGFRLSNHKYVNAMKKLTMCEISIFSYDQRIATTILEKDDPYNTAMKLPEYISKAVLAGNPYSGSNKIAGRNAIAKYFPIMGADNEAVGMIGIGYYTAEDMNKILLFAILGILITFITIAICIFLARFIMKIVERHLSGMMNEVRKSDEAARIAIEEKNMHANIVNIMNSLDIMIFINDPETSEILFMNESMRQQYNIKEDPRGKICYKILRERHNERCHFCPCFKLDINPGGVMIWNEYIPSMNSTYRRVDRYINWPNGKTVHLQHSFDITELIAAKESAELSNRSKGFFLAQMSHEVRTPMNVILGISEIQLLDKTLSPTAEEGYRKIYESGRLLINIMNDILDFSKIDAGKLEIVCEKYDIPSLINDVIQLNRLRFKNKLITFKINLDENTPNELVGDELRIKQILHNLLSNAFKYTEVGEVELSVYAQDGQNDETVLIVFCIRDTGQGMSENQISRLFDEYTRFNMDTNRSISGTGLGMSITKRLISMMDGVITVESKPGEGSLFTVRLPQTRCTDAVCGSKIAKNLREFNFRSMSQQKDSGISYEQMPYGKVLVVDDVESNLLVAKGLLLPYGLRIDTAKSGFEAIEKIESEKSYDIVFMDHMMPKMDGLKTTKALRAMGYTHPIVALTANAVVGQQEMFMANGFDGFISKPIDTRDLNNILIEFIRNKKNNGENEFKETRIIYRSDEIAAATALDIKNAVTVLEDILPDIKTEGSENMELFITTVHGMKSALSNIGENTLASLALRLEQAGNRNDIAVIRSETTEFITMLAALADKIKQSNQKDNEEVPPEISPADKDFLLEKLNIIKASCKELNIKDAKTTLVGIKQKTWSYKINEMLNEISVYIVRGELAKAEGAVDKLKEILFSEKDKENDK